MQVMLRIVAVMLMVLWGLGGHGTIIGDMTGARVQEARAQEAVEIPIAYIAQDRERPPRLSNAFDAPDDNGIAGGEISIKDNNTTGQFLGQHFSLVHINVERDGDVIEAYERLYKRGIRFFVLNVPAASLLRLSDHAGADHVGADVLFFNVGARDTHLRDADCRANVYHIVPSRAMLTDALAQFLVWKKWSRWFLIVGTHATDKDYAASIRNSAKKFGAKVVVEKSWDFGPDARRTAQAEVPVFTQVDGYDVAIVANEFGDFGDYILYRTWEPKLVAGTHGLVPTTWHQAQEQWGSAQLQSRFLKQKKRYMSDLDYQVWAAIRAIGEGAARTGGGDFSGIADYIGSDAFELAGFKGVALTFRRWNQQLRQPIILVQPMALVSVSPQDGFFHEISVLDTMGVDQWETNCVLAKKE